LSFNKLSIIKQRQFQKLNNLEVLDLSYNEIFYFEKNAFFET
jgi:Leucine-rich repeat (LRR) protein